MDRRLMRLVALSALSLGLIPGTALGAEPIAAPEGFAELRARFEGKSGDEIAAMGYIAEPPVCVSEPGMGGMGVHALNIANFQAQFAAGVMDPEKPTVVLLDASLERVIGLEWEAADVGEGAPEAFGQPALLLPGHPGPPGTDEHHYMLHAYFRPGGERSGQGHDGRQASGLGSGRRRRRLAHPPTPALVRAG
jgi:hypothetical protein